MNARDITAAVQELATNYVEAVRRAALLEARARLAVGVPGEPRVGESRQREPLPAVRKPRQRAAGPLVGAVLPPAPGSRRVAVEIVERPARGRPQPIAAAASDGPQRHPALNPDPVAPIGDRFQQIEAARLRRIAP